MTEDANNPELKRAYRDLATETTPAELDDKVLRMATRQTRSRYGIARAWVRPVAWAATIGLSLAIVLEVTQVIPPAADEEPAALSEPAGESAGESAPLSFSADESHEGLQQETANREDAAETLNAVSRKMSNAPASPGGGTVEQLGATRAAPRDLPAEKEKRPVVLDDADAFAARDIRILEEAEVQARQRAGDPGIATFAGVATEADAAYCDETARATAESWYECIEKLREAGDTEFADTELAELARTFPDFEVPAASK